MDALTPHAWTRRTSALLLALAGCTGLKPGDDLRDAAIDVHDADPDTHDACADPPIGDCPPLCLRPRVIAGQPFTGVGRVVSGDETWTCDNLWILEDDTYVQRGTLRIEAGTLVLAEPDAALVIANNARLVVEGERDAPVSIRPPSDYAPGDEWRGLYMLGNAPVLNDDGDRVTRSFSDLNGDRSTHGGDDPEHDCGSLRYLRLEFGGGGPDLEGEGLFMGGCGSATTVDYVQVHETADDAFVIHGGGFDIRHLVITASDQDALQWERGWNGTVQHYVGHMSVASNYAVVQAEGPLNTAEPMSSGVVANLTAVGTGLRGPAILVNGSSLRVGNSIAVVREAVLNVDSRHSDRWDFDEVSVLGSVLNSQTTDIFEDPEVEAIYQPPAMGNSDDPAGLPDTGTVLRSNISWRPADGSVAFDDRDPITGVEPTRYAGAIDPTAELAWTEGWLYLLGRPP